MSQTLSDALREATLVSDDYVYRFVKLPVNAVTAAAGVIAEAGNPFSALILDKDEVTLMIEDEDFEQFKKRLLNHEVSEIRYRLITFQAVLEPTLVGFMSTIATALAEENISVMPFAAYSTDHIFVSEADFEKAVGVLKNLKASIS
ncbi:MAG: ACT domain-containing protein [Chloroflexota bacterium]